MDKLQKIQNPILFQGKMNYKNYFEGWYYKQVSDKTKMIISFIPGVSLNATDPHSFVQVITSPPIKTHYFKYPIEAFKTSDKPFEVQIGNNFFTDREIKINLSNEDISIEGHLMYGEFTKINTSLLHPNIMGCFGYIPKMECNHGVISMNHDVNGYINYGLKEIEFANDRGYIEKDWGTSFPKKYIWIQCNNFKSSKDSIICSVAEIPYLGLTFDGFIVNFHHKGKEYRFATYNRSKLNSFSINKETISLEIRKKNLKLHIEAKVNSYGELKAPNKGIMSRTIKEGLGGKVNLSLYENDKKIVDMTSQYAGIEIVGYSS